MKSSEPPPVVTTGTPNTTDAPKESRVPAGRLSRLVHLGAAASRIAVGGAKEVSTRLLKSEASGAHPLLTVDNARVLAKRLSRLRGAAMKVGQMLSLEGDSMLPKAFADALGPLRDSADVMPRDQVQKVLQRELGADFEQQFESFDYTPIASASIGQVHRGSTFDGRVVALKIQYPGIAKSIDSDVDNLSSLLKLSRLVPSNVPLGEFTAEIKRQLREEVDYERELSRLIEYRTLVASDPALKVPRGYPDLSTNAVLAMEYVPSLPLATWAKSASQAERDRVAAQLLRLVLRELFEFSVVQTDPNFSNYHYDTNSDRLVLLDFGATRSLPPELRQGYAAIIKALVNGDYAKLHDALVETGFLKTSCSDAARSAVTRITLSAHEVFALDKPYDFAVSNLPQKFKAGSDELSSFKRELEPPAPAILFFQRKLGGTFLLCRNLRARVNCRALVAEFSL